MVPEDSNALDVLLTRRSVPALLLHEPGPSSHQIDAAIAAALRAPDHGNLKPWRCVLVRGEARARLSELFVRCMQQRDPPAPPGKVEKARTMPLAAPLIIAVGVHVRADHKIPEVEQLLSAGAATMNLMNAFHAQGYGAIWLTGPNSYDTQISNALGFAADERCLGFIYVGTADAPQAPGPLRPDKDLFVRDWGG